MSICKLFLSVSLYVFSNTVVAQESEVPTSHCAATEFIVVNATMGQFVRGHSGRTLKKDGKVMSLCTDVPQEPFGMVAYRYGRIGHVELEQVASDGNKFGVLSRSTSSHTGEEVLFFKKEKTNYYVISAIGQANGVSLLVYRSGKKIVDLFSGTDSNTDFQVGPAYIDYDHIKSPVFAKMDAPDNF